MRVPEDYIMGTTGKKDSGFGCSFLLILFIIGVIVLACAIDYSAPSSPLGEWVAETWAEMKMIGIVMLSVAGFVTLMLIITGKFSKKK